MAADDDEEESRPASPKGERPDDFLAMVDKGKAGGEDFIDALAGVARLDSAGDVDAGRDPQHTTLRGDNSTTVKF